MRHVRYMYHALQTTKQKKENNYGEREKYISLEADFCEFARKCFKKFGASENAKKTTNQPLEKCKNKIGPSQNAKNKLAQRRIGECGRLSPMAPVGI